MSDDVRVFGLVQHFPLFSLTYINQLILQVPDTRAYVCVCVDMLFVLNTGGVCTCTYIHLLLEPHQLNKQTNRTAECRVKARASESFSEPLGSADGGLR